MSTRLLFPHRFRLIGWAIFLPSALLGLAAMYADFSFSWLVVPFINEPIKISLGASQTNLVEIQNLTDELAGLGVIVGLLLIAFSKEKTEDEMIGHLRLEALQWSVYANYLVLAVAMLLVYDLAFFSVLVYNMFTLLLVFIVRYRWLIWKNSATLPA